MWILLVVIEFDTFATVLETAEECRLLWQLNAHYWAQTGQIARAVCMRTWAA
jgi:hypothetical protein